jgi:AhpD family alkylhydroperoxidase
LYRAVMTSTATLLKVEREIIALVVSGLNGCHY